MTGNGAETLASQLAPVIEEFDGVERVASAGGDELRVGDRLIAILGRDRLEVGLDPDIAAAAQRTPDVTAGSRGPGWVSFRPRVIDQFALDRAEAWLRIAHRGVSNRG